MTHGKRHAGLLILFLALGVAAREAPEIIELTDDWSNDGTAVGYEDPLPRLTFRQLKSVEVDTRPTRTPRAFVNPGKKRLWFGATLSSSSKAGPEILHLLAIQRK